MKIRKLLQKMAWKTHRWDTKISLFTVYLGGDHNKFGFKLLNIDKGIRWEGSLFEITWSFPTVTHAGELVIDVFFLYEKWDNWCIDMSDRKLWGSKLNAWERFNYYIHGKFKSIR